MTEQEKLSLIIELISRQQGSIDAHNDKVEQILSQMPFDHLQQHDLLRLHLAHIPAPKDHGDDHEFTQSMKKHVGTIVDVIVKSVGVAIVTILGLGIVAWMVKNNGIADHMQRHPQEIRQQIQIRRRWLQLRQLRG